MTKAEFIAALEGALAGASPEERAAALQYYSEYFDEAGPEREAAVAEELGDPLALAADIMGTAPAAGGARGAKAAPGQASPGPGFGMPPPPKAPTPPPHAAQGGFGGAGAQDVAYMPVETLPAPLPAPPRQDREWYNQRNMTVLKVIILIFACIFLVPLFGGLIAGLAGIAVAIVVCFAVPLVVGVALVLGGIASFVAGILIMAPSPGSGLVSLGLGVLLIMLGLMSFYGGVKLYSKALPAIIKGVGQLVRSLAGLIKGLFQQPNSQYTEGYHG